MAGELAACQRFYYRLVTQSGYGVFSTGVARVATAVYASITFPVTMRAVPSTTLDTTGTAGQYACIGSNVVACSALPVVDQVGTAVTSVVFTTAGSLVVGQAYMIANTNTANVYIGFSAEL